MSRLNRFFCFTLSLITVLTVLIGYEGFGYASSSKNFNGVRKEQGKVKINVENIPLKQVLEMINYHSGINFQGYSEQFDKKITVNIDANSWPEAIKELLIDFGKIEVGDGKQLKTVWLLGGDHSEGPVWVSHSGSNGSRNGVNGRKAALKDSKYSPNASKIPQSSINSPRLYNKLKRISSLSFNDPIPESFVNDKDLKPFFRQFGIRSIDDLKNKKQSHRLKKMAKRRVQAMEEISKSQRIAKN